MTTVKEHLESMKDLYKNPDEHIAVHLWSADDVLGKALDMKIKISKRKANDIIDNIHRHCDSSLGITWTTIECALEEYK